MPTSTQDKSFGEEMTSSVDETTVKMSNSTLDNAISWMQSNLEPDDVFTDKQLKDWAERNRYEEK